MDKDLAFDIILQNERKTSNELSFVRESLSQSDPIFNIVFSRWHPDAGQKRVFYISDIHLMHKLRKAKTLKGASKILGNIIKEILFQSHGLLVIVGDVSSDFRIFKVLFDGILDYSSKYFMIDNQFIDLKRIVFVLGNHDLWSFKGKLFSEIIEEYQSFFNTCNEKSGPDGIKFYLLQNSVYYELFEHDNSFEGYSASSHFIQESELLALSVDSLHNRLKDADFIMFGGIGFSGCNKAFNAKNGIYQDIISRREEIRQSKRCEMLYNKVCASCQRPIVIATHMPIEDWKQNWTTEEYNPGYVYLSGHTHCNYFFDDDFTRVYADCQIGYKSKDIVVKWFDIQGNHDVFADYLDGIYEISKDEYNAFYHGINIGPYSLNRNVAAIYMLKKNRYYCFIAKSASKKGSLLFLNGGQTRLLNIQDIQYYYNNMDQMITAFNEPVSRYTKLQKQISKQIKAFGGKGKIHGCIVDIDFYNHIYVNPYDLSLVPYWAHDIIDKKVYSNVASLLYCECPGLYDNYVRALESKKKNELSVIGDSEISTEAKSYYNTDIYKESRYIKKMQRIQHRILCMWDDNLLQTVTTLNDNYLKKLKKPTSYRLVRDDWRNYIKVEYEERTKRVTLACFSSEGNDRNRIVFPHPCKDTHCEVESDDLIKSFINSIPMEQIQDQEVVDKLVSSLPAPVFFRCFPRDLLSKETIIDVIDRHNDFGKFEFPEDILSYDLWKYLYDSKKYFKRIMRVSGFPKHIWDQIKTETD